MSTDIIIKVLKKLVSNVKKAIRSNHSYESRLIAAILELGYTYSRKENPYDNVCIESFHSVIKKEMIP